MSKRLQANGKRNGKTITIVTVDKRSIMKVFQDKINLVKVQTQLLEKI